MELLAVAGVELEDPQRLAVGREQGNAHDRADLEVGDRRAGGQVLVHAGVLAEDGLLLDQDVVDDRPADAHLGLVGGDGRGELSPPPSGAAAEGLADQPLGVGIDEDQEEPLGLGKELHQRIEDPRADLVDLQLGGEVAGDLEDGLELHLGLHQAGHRTGARGVQRVQVGDVVVLGVGNDHDLAVVLGAALRRAACDRTETRRRRC